MHKLEIKCNIKSKLHEGYGLVKNKTWRESTEKTGLNMNMEIIIIKKNEELNMKNKKEEGTTWTKKEEWKNRK